MGCKKGGYCDYCDSRCPDFIFEFSNSIMESSEIFEKEFLKWYDCDKPDSNFEDLSDYPSVGRFLLGEWEPEDIIRGDDRRWSVWIDKIYKIGNRYFMTGYDQGLTEMQENEYYDTDVVEVEPQIRVVVKKDWSVKK